jgi:superfamily I DNA/RNA helicase
LATEVSRKELKKLHEMIFQKSRELSESSVEEFFTDFEKSFIYFINNQKRKAEITNKRRFDDISQESDRSQELIDKKVRKICDKQNHNSGKIKTY